MKIIDRLITAALLLMLAASMSITACAVKEETAVSAAAEAGTEEVTGVREGTDGVQPGMASFSVDDSDPRSFLQEDPDGIVSYEGKKYKRKKNVKAVLGLGIDRHDRMSAKDSVYDNGTSDAVFLIAQDTSDNKLKMLIIPRDSMTEMDMIDDEGNVWTAFEHINIAFTNGDGRHESCKASARAVSDLLCGLEIDHYIAFDLSVIPYVNDAVGGVTVIIPNDQLVKANPDWKKGAEVTLLGDDAERFVRYRDTGIEGSPVSRLEQHRAYISGFTDALKSKSRKDSGIVSRLSDDIVDYIVTDMNKGEYEKIALDGLQGGFDVQKDVMNLPGHAEAGEEYDGEVYDQYYVDYTQAVPVLLDLFYREVD